MGSGETCVRCGETFDKAECNKTYAVFSILRDSDATGQKTERVYLCGTCAEMVLAYVKAKGLEGNPI